MSRSRRAKTQAPPAVRRAAVPTTTRGPIWLPWIIVAAGVLAYANGLSGPFIFDDHSTIVSEAPSAAGAAAIVSAPTESPLAGRPLVTATFFLNRAFFGAGVTSFHAVNLAVHLLNALLFFAIVRRTLQLPGLGDRWGEAAPGVAFAAALIWTVHPLNSEVVDYLTQRTESMMALCLLTTLYAGLRAASGAAWWQAVSIAACALGMLCKETMVVAPLIVALYDRVFLFPSWQAAWRARGRLYTGLAAGWLVLAGVMWSAPRTSHAGFTSTDASSWTYFVNQGGMLARYLRLTVWPTALVLNYGWSWPTPLAAMLPYLALIALLFLATAVALVRAPRAGFLGAWCFVILAPTSSVVAIASEVGAERRMYLPLMALLMLGVLSAVVVWRRVRPATASWRMPANFVLAAIVLSCTGLTIVRNREYSSGLTMARTVLTRWPSGFAHHMVGFELGVAGDHTGAIEHLRQAVAGFPPARYDLGRELLTQGQPDEAVEQLQAFLREEPRLMPRAAALMIAQAEGLRANALSDRQAFDLAVPHYQAFLALNPKDGNGWTRLGVALVALDRLPEAVTAFRRAVEAVPDSGPFHLNLARGLLDTNAGAEAEAEAQRAVAANPQDPAAYDVLGRAQASQGRFAEARRAFERALQLDPTFPPALDGLRRLAGKDAR